MDKYQEALDYVNKSVCTALSCLGVNDTKTKESLHTLQELVDEYRIVRSNANLEIANKKLKSENKKLKKAIAILNRIYGFKLQDIKYSGYYELLIPDMTSDELSKEEYELLDEVMEKC